MTVLKEVRDKGLMTRVEEDILLLKPNPEYIIFQEVPITGKTITTIEVTAGSPDLEVHPDLLMRPGVAAKSPSRGNDRCFSCREFGHFSREMP